MNKINFKNIIKNHDIQYAQQIYPSVVFVNKMIENENGVHFTINYLKNLLNDWNTIGMHTLFSDKIVNAYIKECSHTILKGIHYNADVVSFWLSYCAGFICNTLSDYDKIFPMLMHMLYSSDGRGFVFSYLPSKTLLHTLQEKIDYSEERLLRKCRLTNDVEDVKAYIDYYTSMPLEKIKIEVSRDSFYSNFCPLPDDVMLLSHYLIKCGMYKEWCDVYQSLNIPFLQVELLSIIRDADNIIPLYLEMCTRVDCNNILDIVRCMLRNKWFQMLVLNTENYIKQVSLEEYDNEVRESYIYYQTYINQELINYIRESVCLFIKKEGIRAVSSWGLSKSMMKIDLNTRSQSHNIVLCDVQKIIVEQSSIDDYNVDVNDIHYLAFVANEYYKQKITDRRCECLLVSIWNHIKSIDFYWTSSLEECYLTDIRFISRLLSIIVDESMINTILDNFYVFYEGISASNMNDWTKNASAESYVFCVLLFMFETDNINMELKKQYFKLVTNRLLHQCHCCGTSFIVDSNYKPALIVAEVIAEQLLHDCKDEFENNLMSCLYEKQTSLQVLTFANKIISKDVRMMITSFRDGDWVVQRNDYLRRKQNNIVNEIENLFAKILNR